MGYISWLVDQANSGSRVFFSFSRVNSNYTTYSGGLLSPFSSPAIVPGTSSGGSRFADAKLASSGLASDQDADWIVINNRAGLGIGAHDDVSLSIDHIERHVLTLVDDETTQVLQPGGVSRGEVIGFLTDPGSNARVPLDLKVHWKRPDAPFCLAGVDGNGAPVGIVIYVQTK